MHPNLFQIGPFTIHTYGVFLALAFLLGMQVAIYYGKQEKFETSYVTDLVFYIFISALLGAKILHVVVDYGYYAEDWNRLWRIYQIGGVYYGGLIFAFLITVWYVRRRKMDFWQTTDVLTMGLAFGQMFGRMGCFFAGCCWGTEAPPGFPLAVTFANPLASQQVGTPIGVPLHPAQLYESLPMMFVFLALAYSFRHRKFAGQQFIVYLFLYSVLRFTVEFFRGDPRGFLFDGLLSISQFISILAFLGAALLLVTRRRHSRTS